MICWFGLIDLWTLLDRGVEKLAEVRRGRGRPWTPRRGDGGVVVLNGFHAQLWIQKVVPDCKIFQNQDLTFLLPSGNDSSDIEKTAESWLLYSHHRKGSNQLTLGHSNRLYHPPRPPLSPPSWCNSRAPKMDPLSDRPSVLPLIRVEMLSNC